VSVSKARSKGRADSAHSSVLTPASLGAPFAGVRDNDQKFDFPALPAQLTAASKMTLGS